MSIKFKFKYDTLLGAVIAANIPMIFFSIVASVCSIEDVAIINEFGTKILLRFFAMMIFITFLSIFICNLFFPVINLDFNASFSLEIKIIFEMILSAIPQNIIEPFIEEKVLQIVILAVIFGIIITTLGNRLVEFKNLIMDLKLTIFKLVELVMNFIPVIVFFCIFKTILVDSLEHILTVWKIIAAEYTLFIILSAVMLLRIKFSYGVKITDFLKKLYPAYLIAFSTGSGMTSMAKNIEICKKDLKVEKNLCDFYISMTHALCPTVMIVGIVTCVFFAAEFSGAQFSIAQLFIVAFLSIQFSLSAIGGNGGMLAILGLLFTQLDISLDAIGTIMISDIFVVNVSGIVALIIRDCDLIDVSHKIKLK